MSLVTSVDQLAETAAGVHREPLRIQAIPAPSDPSPGRRFLRRVLDTDEFGLLREDGVRVATAAKAYPLILEALRRVERGNLSKDQRGYPLVELMGFKVRLSEPDRDLVPAFYESDGDSLAEYYQEQFQNKGGLFRDAMEGQFDIVKEHIVEAVQDISSVIATRRAILVLENKVGEGEPLAPLGLVSVWIAPRVAGDHVTLSFGFTWRTVEALVGFPYSLYGSCRFAEDFVDNVRGQLAAERRRDLRLGEVSYWAHSLHMFVDAYSDNIVRRIIDDASD